MSDSLVCCCLCLRDIEKSYERVNLEKCKKDFDSLAEIESLEISHLDSKYICRQCTRYWLVQLSLVNLLKHTAD